MFKLYHWHVDSAMYDRKEHVNSAVVGGGGLHWRLKEGGLKGRFWGVNSPLYYRKWKTGKSKMQHKVCYAVPRARAWLRPWRSTWMKAAAAGRVWGHKQMSFTTSSTGLLVFCQSSHFNLPDFSHMQLGGTQGKMKKTQYKVGNCFLVAFDGLPAQATNEQFIFWCAAWHTIDATLKTKSCMAYCTFPLQGLPCHPSFPFVHRLRHVKTVICLGGNTSAHSGALKLSFVQGHWRSTKRLWKSFNTFFYQQPSDLREESCNNAAHSKFHKKLWFFEISKYPLIELWVFAMIRSHGALKLEE